MRVIERIQKRINVSSVRSRNILRHVGWSFMFKLGSVLCNLILVSLAIRYLGTESYGVWLTLSSVISWFVLFDVGLGNGLRNKFSESIAKDEGSETRAYVSTAYFTIAVIGSGLAIVVWMVNQHVNWASAFNVPNSLASELKILIPVAFTFFSAQLVAKLITSIYLADQQHSIQDKIQFFTQIALLVGIIFLFQHQPRSLLAFGVVYTALPVALLVLLNVIAFSDRYAPYRPTLRSVKKSHLAQILDLGLSFFVIQIAGIVLFSTGNFIIAQLFGPAEVVPYNIAYKYFSLITLGFGVLVSPFWSSVTEAWTINDIGWILKALSNIQRLWLLVPAGLIVLMLGANSFYELWIGDDLVVPFAVSAWTAIFVALQTAATIYTTFINGIGFVRLQLVSSTFFMIINIPLSIFLASDLGLGPSGVIMSPCFCLLCGIVLRFIQLRKVLNGSATGCWSK